MDARTSCVPYPLAMALRRLATDRDVLIAGSVFILALVEAATTRAAEGHRPLAFAALGLIAVALAWRSRAPWIPVAVTAVCVPALTAAGVGPNAALTVTVAVVLTAYSAGRHLSMPGAAAACVVLVAGATVSVILDDRSLAANVPFAVGLCVAPWAAGTALRRRHVYASTIEERAEAATEAALSAERARIARELHDVVSHTLTVIGLQAGGVRRLLLPSQEREREALLVVEESARQAHDEMRRLLHVMRDEDGGNRQPQPGLAALPALLDDATRTGLEVDFDPTELRLVPSLPAGLDLTAFRIVQEALTNTRRHAGATRVAVRVKLENDHLEIEVTDNGVARNGRASPDGFGLLGMQERVSLYSGTLEAGAQPEGGFRVSARLPLTQAAI